MSNDILLMSWHGCCHIYDESRLEWLQFSAVCWLTPSFKTQQGNVKERIGIMLKKGPDDKHEVKMMTKMSLDEIRKFWPFIVEGLCKALCTSRRLTNELLQNVFEACKKDIFQVWALDGYAPAKNEVQTAIAVTTIIEEKILKSKALMIYTIYSTRTIDLKLLYEGFTQLREYAREQECSAIVSFSNNKKGLELARLFGAATTTNHLIMDL